MNRHAKSRFCKALGALGVIVMLGEHAAALTISTSGPTALPFSDEVQTFQVTQGKTDFALQLPEASPVVISLDGLPEGSDVMLGIAGWPAGRWVSSKGKSSVEIEFTPENTRGTVWVQITLFGSKSTDAWSGQQFTRGGPYYTIRDTPNRPTEANGLPVEPPLTLSLKTRFKGDANVSRSPRPETPQAVTNGDPNRFSAEWTAVAFEYPSGWYRGDHKEETTLIEGDTDGFAAARISVVKEPLSGDSVKEMMAEQRRWDSLSARLVLSNHLTVDEKIIPYFMVAFNLKQPNASQPTPFFHVSLFAPEAKGRQCRLINILVTQSYWKEHPEFIKKFTGTLTLKGGVQ